MNIYSRAPRTFTRKYHMHVLEGIIQMYPKAKHEYTQKYHRNLLKSTTQTYSKVPHKFTRKYHTNVLVCNTWIYTNIPHEFLFVYMEIEKLGNTTKYYTNVYVVLSRAWLWNWHLLPSVIGPKYHRVVWIWT